MLDCLLQQCKIPATAACCPGNAATSQQTEDSNPNTNHMHGWMHTEIPRGPERKERKKASFFTPPSSTRRNASAISSPEGGITRLAGDPSRRQYRAEATRFPNPRFKLSWGFAGCDGGAAAFVVALGDRDGAGLAPVHRQGLLPRQGHGPRPLRRQRHLRRRRLRLGRLPLPRRQEPRGQRQLRLRLRRPRLRGHRRPRPLRAHPPRPVRPRPTQGPLPLRPIPAGRAIHPQVQRIHVAVVNFIYSDELPSIHELAGSISMWTSTVAIQHLLAAADRYGLDRLRLLCEAKLCDELTAETVATTLALAEQHHCAQLKSACLKFTAVRENLGAVILTEGFNYLEETCPSLLSDLLATVAVVDDDPASLNRKRGVSGNEGANQVESIEASERRTRRKV